MSCAFRVKSKILLFFKMDWRSSIPTQSRQEAIKKLIQVVKLAAPGQDQAKLADLATSTELAIFEKSKSRVCWNYIKYLARIYFTFAAKNFKFTGENCYNSEKSFLFFTNS